MAFLYCIAFSFLNCARGRKLFDLTDSTTISRVVSTLGMAIATAFLTINGDWYKFDWVLLWTWASLMLWATPAWDVWWGMASGQTTPVRPGWKPVDWLMAKLWTAPTPGTFKARLWGTVAMGLRMALAAPCVIGLAFLTGHPEHAWIALLTPLLGIPYFVCGFPQVYRFFPADAGIPASECFVGYGLGTILTLAT